MESYEEIKKELAIGDQEVSEFFHYKNRNSFNTSSKKPYIVKGIEKLIAKVRSKFVLLSYEEAEAVKETLEAVKAEGFEFPEKALESIKNQLPK